jgi:predicted transcriptional regulator
MERIELYSLLKIIKQNNNLNSLLRAGFSYKRIGEFTELAGENELVVISERGITLTPKGEARLTELKEINKKINKNEWIELELISKIKPLDIDFIYLPPQDELFL